jgi:hypothetical protein
MQGKKRKKISMDIKNIKKLLNNKRYDLKFKQSVETNFISLMSYVDFQLNSDEYKLSREIIRYVQENIHNKTLDTAEELFKFISDLILKDEFKSYFSVNKFSGIKFLSQLLYYIFSSNCIFPFIKNIVLVGVVYNNKNTILSVLVNNKNKFYLDASVELYFNILDKDKNVLLEENFYISNESIVLGREKNES